MIGDRTYTRRQTTSGWSAGKPDITTADTPIRGSLQPASGEVLEQLTEGERARGVMVLRTRQDLSPADKVLAGADVYKVLEVRSWTSMLGYREAILVLEVEDQPAGAA